MFPTLRRSVLHIAALVAGAAALLLLTACGGDGDSAADPTADGAAESETAATSAAAGEDEFCAQAADIDQRVDAALTDLEGSDPSVVDAFSQLSEELRAMDPPEDIAADWEALAAGVDELGAAFENFDLTDPDALAGLEAAEGELTDASTNVENYLRDECGIEP